MLLRPALRAPFSPSCNIHSLGLTTRTFTTSPTSLVSHRLPHQSIRSSSRTATLPLRRHPLLLTTTALGATALALAPYSKVHYDSSPFADFSTSASGYSHGRDAKVPISKDGGRTLNPAAIKQISFGSIVGLGLGVLVSAFSKMLVLVVGVGVVVVQVSVSPFSPRHVSGVCGVSKGLTKSTVRGASRLQHHPC